MTQAQLVDVLWERLTRDGPGGEGTVTPEWNALDSAIRAAACHLVEPYRSSDLRPSEDEWLDEVVHEATGTALRVALAAMTQTVMEMLPAAPAGLLATSERLFVDLALPRDEELPEHLRPSQAA